VATRPTGAGLARLPDRVHVRRGEPAASARVGRLPVEPVERLNRSPGRNEEYACPALLSADLVQGLHHPRGLGRFEERAIHGVAEA